MRLRHYAGKSINNATGDAPYRFLIKCGTQINPARRNQRAWPKAREVGEMRFECHRVEGELRGEGCRGKGEHAFGDAPFEEVVRDGHGVRSW